MRSPASRLVAERLFDVLSTLEATFATSVSPPRGAGPLLSFACRALPCEEAVLAIRRGPLHQVRVELVVDAAGAREEAVDVEIDGTLFGPTFGGHGAVWTSLRADDERLGSLGEVVAGTPSGALVVPIVVQASVVGAVAFFSAATPSERDRRAAEPLLEGLGIALGAMVTERFLVRLFAALVPELMGDDAATDLPSVLARYADRMGSAPAHRRALALGAAAQRLGARGDEEAELALDVLERFVRYGEETRQKRGGAA